ncbi:DUF4838 domain-containing protein [Paenibacillus chungangensis]|uniref:DUF4838 domain-containing protein n=1 Tax=Paenibacillus chungangensis TaxID=696535 RepID=A0ABW3HV85_9BACL
MIGRRGIILDLYDLHEAWPDLLHEAGINVLGIHNWSGSNQFSEKIDEIAAYVHSPEGSQWMNRLQRLGIEVEYELHAMSWLLPRDLYGRYPEWFRMDEHGTRTPSANFCPSHEDALEMIRGNAVRLARLLPPTTERYYMWQDDNQPWCKCERCRSYSDSDQTLMVNNAIAEAIRTVRSDAKLSHLAYMHTLESPPQQVTPAEGIFLEIAGPIIHRHEHPNYADGSPEELSRLRDDRKFVKALERNLQVFGAEDAQALDYWLDASFFSKWKKPARELIFNEEQTADDIQFYRDMNIGSISSFGVFLDREYFSRYGHPPVVAYGDILGRTK